MTKVKIYLLGLLVTIGMSMVMVPFVQPGVAFASDEATQQACDGIGGTTGKNGDCSTGGVQVGEVITFAVTLLSVIVGIASVIMIIIGGFKYVTSNGDSNGIASAKNTIIYAIVGLIIAGLAQVIARFVIGSL